MAHFASLELSTGLLDLAQQYTEWALKRKVEHLIKESLSIDNVASFYSFAVKYEAKVP